MSKDAEKFWSYELDQKGRERYLRMADGSDKYADSGWSSMPKPLRSFNWSAYECAKIWF